MTNTCVAVLRSLVHDSHLSCLRMIAYYYSCGVTISSTEDKPQEDEIDKHCSQRKKHVH